MCFVATAAFVSTGMQNLTNRPMLNGKQFSLSSTSSGSKNSLGRPPRTETDARGLARMGCLVNPYRFG
jgi:hypothetical protein